MVNKVLSYFCLYSTVKQMSKKSKVHGMNGVRQINRNTQFSTKTLNINLIQNSRQTTALNRALFPNFFSVATP